METNGRAIEDHDRRLKRLEGRLDQLDIRLSQSRENLWKMAALVIGLGSPVVAALAALGVNLIVK